MFRHFRRRAAVCCLLSAAFCLFARADVFVLKDGTKYEGTSTEDGQVLIITTFDGKVVRISKSLVQGSVSDPKRNEFFEKKRKLKDDDAAGHFELGNWADKNGMRKEAVREFERVLEIAPAHEGAGRALNYELRDGKWQTPTDFEVRIAPRPTPKNWDARRDDLRAAATRLTKAPIGDGPFEMNAEAKRILNDVMADPEFFARLLIPPNYPGAVPGAENPIVRARAAWLLGNAKDRRAMEPLINSAIYDPEEKVRIASAKALPQLEEPIAIRKMTDMAISKDVRRYPWAVRKLAAQALRRYGNKEVVDRLLREFSFEVAGGNALDEKNKLRGSGKGLGSDNPLGAPDSIPDLGLSQEDLYPVLAVLKEVTGQEFNKGERDVRTWANWWMGAKEKFEFKD